MRPAVSGLDDVSGAPFPEPPQLCLPYAAGAGVADTSGNRAGQTGASARVEEHDVSAADGTAGWAAEPAAPHQLYVSGASLCRFTVGAVGSIAGEIRISGGVFSAGTGGIVPAKPSVYSILALCKTTESVENER